MTEKYNPFVMLIKFGDNDFCSTFACVLKMLQSINYSTTDKNKLLKTINELSYPAYRLAQNNFEYDNGQGEEAHSNHIKNYLTIKESNLVLGHKEVDKYLLETNWNNGEDFVFDTRLTKDSQIYCI